MRKKKEPSAPPSRSGARRPPDEIGALSERFYEVVSRKPGETMAVLAPIVGATARELNRPVILLRRAGRIRSVGIKHATRYFPMAREVQRGSYLAICSGCVAGKDSLTCKACRDAKGKAVESSLALPCGSDVANCNGKLRCGGCR